MQPVRFPWDIIPTPVPVAEPADEEVSTKETPRGRRPRSALRSATPAADAAPDWLYHHLTISGRAEAVGALAAAARGSGVIPWRLDFADIEETVFTLAVSQPAGRRSLTVEGCRILARQFRDKVEAHQARAAALVGNSLAGSRLHSATRSHPSRCAGLVGGAVGCRRPAAASDRAGEGDGRAAAAARPHGDRLRVLHRRRDAARGGRSARGAMAGAAPRAAAASGRLTRGRHGRCAG
jgi:hypothetical protein